MKTAAEWLELMEANEMAATDDWLSREKMVATIQLDALRAGEASMRAKAAAACFNGTCENIHCSAPETILALPLSDFEEDPGPRRLD